MIYPIETSILNIRGQGLAYCICIDLDPSSPRHFLVTDIFPKVVAVAFVVLRIQKLQAEIGNSFVAFRLIHPELVCSALGRIDEEVTEREVERPDSNVCLGRNTENGVEAVKPAEYGCWRNNKKFREG
jgi:hypothetical protein